MIIIPAIDMKDGSCVRLYQGEFDQQTVYSKDPVAVAHNFQSLGFSHLHMVDLDGAQSGNQKNQDIVRRISKATDFAIQLGGGVRNLTSARLWLQSGVDRCVVGSLAVTRPESVKEWLKQVGGERLVLALDVRINECGSPLLSTHGWTQESETSLWQCVDGYLASGLRHVLCTDISRDGAMSGPNVELYREFIRRYPEISLQASGGVRHIGDLEALRNAGAAAAITGRALLDGRISKEEISSFQHAA